MRGGTRCLPKLASFINLHTDSEVISLIIEA